MIKEYLEKKASFVGWTAAGALAGGAAGTLSAYLKNKKIHPDDPTAKEQKKTNYINHVSRGLAAGTGVGIVAGAVLPKLHEKHLNRKIDKATDKYVGKKLDAREHTRSSMKWFARPFVKSKRSTIKGAHKELNKLKSGNKSRMFESVKSLRTKSKIVKNSIR